MTGKIDISPAELAIVQVILRQHLPKGARTWAFGSRVTWTAKPFSDLDLAVEAASPLPLEVMGDLNEAFENSDLPWRVDVIDLKSISPEFRAIVERQRVPADWKKVNLDDVFVFSSGLSKPRSEFGSGYPFLTFKDVFYNTFVPSELGGLVTSTETERANCSIKRGDVFLTRTSETLDELGMSCVALQDVPNATFNGFTKRLRPNGQQEVSPEYLGYYFKNSKFRAAVNAMATMSTRASLNNSMLAVLPLVLPPLAEQSEIAQVLKSLDDKIELNRQMNQTLEAMARAVFLDWFVDFGPTRRKAAGAADPAAILGGLIPDGTQAAPLAALFPNSFGANGLPMGWTWSTIGAELETLLGGTPSRVREDYWGGDVPWINSGKANEFRVIEASEYITQAGYDNSATKLMPKRTTLIAITGATLGQVSLNEIEVCANQSIVGVVGDDQISSEYVYCWIKENIGKLVAAQTGGAQQHINKNNVNDLPIIVPRAEIMGAWQEVSMPLFDLIASNCFENQTLAATRDLLLPKLMSGDLRLVGEEAG